MKFYYAILNPEYIIILWLHFRHKPFCRELVDREKNDLDRDPDLNSNYDRRPRSRSYNKKGSRSRSRSFSRSLWSKLWSIWIRYLMFDQMIFTWFYSTEYWALRTLKWSEFLRKKGSRSFIRSLIIKWSSITSRSSKKDRDHDRTILMPYILG